MDEKEAGNLEKIHNHSLDKRKKVIESTQFKAEDVFVIN